MVVPNPLLAVVVVVKPNPPNPLLVDVVRKPPKPLLAVLPNPPVKNEPVPPELKILDEVVFVFSPNPKTQR